jgi:hypothetical protein
MKPIALLVSNSNAYTMFIRKDLTEAGYEIVFCRTVGEVSDYVSSDKAKPQIVLMDMFLPYLPLFSSEETEFGMRTGVPMYYWLRKNGCQAAIVIYTLLAEYKDDLASVKDPKLIVLNENFQDSSKIAIQMART